MKLSFQTGRSYRANKIELGDKHDQSIVHLLSTLPSKTFLVENKDGSWSVTTGQIIADTPVTVSIASQSVTSDRVVEQIAAIPFAPAPVTPAVITKTKPKPKQPKKKKR